MKLRFFLESNRLPLLVSLIFDQFSTRFHASGKAEILLGSILKKNGWKRSSYIITTKIYWGGKTENAIKQFLLGTGKSWDGKFDDEFKLLENAYFEKFPPIVVPRRW